MGAVLVTGATGKVGRHVVAGLLERGEQVRAASRNPKAPEGATGVSFDWTDESTWDAALDGVDRLYLVAQAEGVFDMAGPALAFLRRAVHAGVIRVVLLSAMGVQYAPDEVPMRRVELGLQQVDVDTTVLRPNWFDQNFDAGVFVPAMLGEQRVPAPTGDARLSFVDTRDIAAVAALTGDGHAGAEYTITGPQALSFADVADVLSRAWGTELRHDDVNPPEMQTYLEGAGLPGPYAEMLTGMMTMMRDGSAEAVTDDVERATGQPARTLADYAATTPGPFASAAAT